MTTRSSSDDSSPCQRGSQAKPRRFTNSDVRCDHRSWRDTLRWMVTRKPSEWHDVPPVRPSKIPDERVEGSALRVTFINHSTVLLQTQGINILTDPIWSRRCGPMGIIGPKRARAPGVRLRDLPRIDVVLISHNHYDHLDLRTLWRLRRRYDPLLCVGVGNGPRLRRLGFGRIEEFGWWQTRELFKDLPLSFVPAQHYARRGVFDHNKSLWGGFVLQSDAGAVYFAGDTGLGPQFEEIRERFGDIRLALLPIGGYSPRWFMGPVHMSPDDAVQAHKILQAHVSVAIHHGTFQLSDEGFLDPYKELSSAMRHRKVPISQFRILEPGEGYEVPAVTHSPTGQS